MSGLVWLCHKCKKPVEDGKGYLHCSYQRIGEYERAKAERRSQQVPWQPVDLKAIMDGPWPAGWQVHHRACDPDVTSSDYWIAVERARTPEKLLDWTAHLFEKTWFQSTSWNNLIRGVLRDSGKQVDA